MSSGEPPLSSSQLTISNRDLLSRLTVRTNLRQQIIIIYENTLRLILLRRLDAIADRREWIPPLGVFATIALTMPTVQYRETLGLSADFWRAFFGFSLVASGIWLFVKVVKAVNAPKLQDLFDEIFESTVAAADQAANRSPGVWYDDDPSGPSDSDLS